MTGEIYLQIPDFEARADPAEVVNTACSLYHLAPSNGTPGYNAYQDEQGSHFYSEGDDFAVKNLSRSELHISIDGPLPRIRFIDRRVAVEGYTETVTSLKLDRKQTVDEQQPAKVYKASYENTFHTLTDFKSSSTPVTPQLLQDKYDKLNALKEATLNPKGDSEQSKSGRIRRGLRKIFPDVSDLD